ncbi:tyrosine-type recombinase/integrase [Desulfovibrio fairfieldensis]|uniref:Tyr recombinase domain-containing protein n=1 Tax=Desulfovibrio fairfieldensis TaxID=44742 RepID=A0A0X8JKB6_9BACT|nr:site-specific integrase [Desulfovibrio fairfieldensis]AMD90242.1 hypothetical protein AXF13_08970 [Desulfovibrio fairfieldensis]
MRLTKRAIEALEATGKRYAAFDDDLKGFAVRVGISGDKSFYLVYRAGKGRAAAKKWLRLGTFPTMTVEQARDIAKTKAAQVAMGQDPAEQVKESKAAPTVKAALALFFEQHDPKIKPSTSAAYHRIAEQHVIPAMGNIKAKAVQHKHIAALHFAMRETPYQANRCAALLSKFFGWCEKSGYRERGNNPVAGLEKYEEHKRKAFMGREELEALGNAFTLMHAQGYTDPKTGKITAFDPVIAAAIKMLLFTGARCMEVLTLKWEYIVMHKGLANLPDSKTGAKVLHLPPPALALLESLPRVNEYCFPGRRGTGHIVNVKDTWRRLLETAGLSGWRIHDLRHAYASYAASSGKSLPVIGAILGHSQPATTQRYAHLADNPVAVAAAETAAQIQKDFTGGKVLPFKKAAG